MDRGGKIERYGEGRIEGDGEGRRDKEKDEVRNGDRWRRWIEM